MRKTTFSGEVYDFLKDLVVIAIIVLLLRTFIAMPFQINGQSMYESYYDREFIIVDRLSYIISEPERGDVIVFRPHVSDTKEFFLKRIIGLPGDSIRIEDGSVYLKKGGENDFVQLDEVYLSDANNGFTFVSSSKARQEYVLGDGDFFVMGDNRNHSTDSRTCFSNCNKVTYYIGKKDIIGKVFLDLGYFNFKSFSFLHPELGIETHPKFFSSSSTHEYE